MKENILNATNGFMVLLAEIVLVLFSIGLFAIGSVGNSGLAIFGAVLLLCAVAFITAGFFVIQPNEACALVLFGDYKGTVKKAGWTWANPFYTKRKISLRSRNLNGERLKVNDEMGNPIEIAAVVVWRVDNTFEALFEVENYIDYVEIQSESALRHLANKYPYDMTDEHHKFSLRGSSDEVAQALKDELSERLGRAGVVVEEARLSHLAYSPEIAAAMLQRQQASAIVAARTKIVEGAVGMVQMALAKLSEQGIIDLDEERKAAMVSNLLVVLCGERASQPIINTGTLHN